MVYNIPSERLYYLYMGYLPVRHRIVYNMKVCLLSVVLHQKWVVVDHVTKI